jgi:[CysO sulfur-carrier protein]-S-L-cysteine hydrolase
MVAIARSVQQQVFAQLLENRPYEGCGLLAGRGGRLERAYPTPNKAESAVKYEIDGLELKRVFEAIDDADLELLAIYHSHTHTQAYPSPTDIRNATYPDAYYIIVTLMDIRGPVMRAFKIVDGEVTEYEVEVFDDLDSSSESLAS